MTDQEAYWNQRIVNWERTAYTNERPERLPLLETVAAPFRKILDRRMRDTERLVAPLVRDRVLLDCGCATGKLLRDLVPFSPKHLIGVDIAQNAIDEGTAIATRLGLSDLMELHCVDLRQDPSLLGKADVVTGLGFLDYLAPAELEALFKELKGKLFVFSFPAKRLGYREILHPIYLRLAHCPGAYTYRKAEMDQLLRRSGITEWWYYDRDQVRLLTNVPKQLS